MNKKRIPVELLCLWEKYYKRGDYKRICELLAGKGVRITPRQLVECINNSEMDEDVWMVFEEYYKEK